MASSSSPRNWKYHVFTSFHGSDVRQGFLSHLRQQFTYNAITMFDDNGIERSQIIAPALIQGIRDSRISIVLLSKNYASSSWCLDELLEILECKEKKEQTVMTIFYGVDPSDVRHQTGDFGKAFRKTCARKTEEKRRKWSEALTYVGNIAGEHFQNWHSEAEKIKKIASDVSDILKTTPSRDFDDIIGLEGHMRKMESLLDLDNVKVKMVGISGPAGIGKSTIARALHSKLSSCFQCNGFMDNLRESYNSGRDKLGLQLYLQEQLLAKVLNLEGVRISNLGVMKDRLQYQKVLIILDDVESLDQLEALANDLTWFGPGSRVIVTTENKEILLQQNIKDIYEVDFPSEREALQIFCLSAFKQTFPPNGFMDLADEVIRICGNLPLGLHVLGSSLREKSPADWINRLPRLKHCLDGRIESVLKVGYESLHEKDQLPFLFIAVYFDDVDVDCVTSVLSNTNLFDVSLGLENLANRYLIHIYHIYGESRVKIHRLLQVMARLVISEQKLSKRKILDHAQDIRYVLENAKGTGSVLGLSLDIAEINKLEINKKALKKMYNLHILKVYEGRHRHTVERELHIPEEMEFPQRIQLFHWDAYPGKSLHRFFPENLVKLVMPNSQLEKLWEGRQPLANLKMLSVWRSSRLKEFPDVTNATNLEGLNIEGCIALVKLPSSIVNLYNISWVLIRDCKSLEVIPTLANWTSLKSIDTRGCSQLRCFPDIPTSIRLLNVSGTRIEELPASLRHCSSLRSIKLIRNKNLKTFSTHLPTSVRHLDLSESGIERITDCIKGLYNLKIFYLSGCKRLVSLPELPRSLEELRARDCESLERVSGPFNTPKAKLMIFTNCLKLDRQAQQTIIQQSFVCGWGLAFLPGREVPAEFDHRARGNSLTIPDSDFNRFKVCIVVSDKRDLRGYHSDVEQDLIGSYYIPDVEFKISVLYRCKVKGNSVKYSSRMKFYTGTENTFRFDGTKHLIIFESKLPVIDSSEVSREIELKFRNIYNDFDITECGIHILTDETDESNNWGSWKEYDESSCEDEDEDDSIANETFESEFGDASDKEVNEENIIEELGNYWALLRGDYDYVSRKRPRPMNINLSLFSSINLFRKENERIAKGFNFGEPSIEDNEEVSEDKVEDIAESEEDNEEVYEDKVEDIAESEEDNEEYMKTKLKISPNPKKKMQRYMKKKLKIRIRRRQ